MDLGAVFVEGTDQGKIRVPSAVAGEGGIFHFGEAPGFGLRPVLGVQVYDVSGFEHMRLLAVPHTYSRMGAG